MSLEQSFERIAAALEAIAAKMGQPVVNVSTTAAPDKKKPPEKKKPAETADDFTGKGGTEGGAGDDFTGKGDTDTKDKGPSIDDVINALQAYMKANGRDAAIKLLASFDGAKRASDVSEAKRADFIKAAKV